MEAKPLKRSTTDANLVGSSWACMCQCCTQNSAQRSTRKSHSQPTKTETHQCLKNASQCSDSPAVHHLNMETQEIPIHLLKKIAQILSVIPTSNACQTLWALRLTVDCALFAGKLPPHHSQMAHDPLKTVTSVPKFRKTP